MSRPPVDAAADAVRAHFGGFPAAAVVLGSGLAGFADALEPRAALACDAIPFWPPIGVAGHAGRILVGEIRRRRVALIAGRTHLYEGGGVRSATFAVEVLSALGVRTLILTSASGGLTPSFRRGTVVIVDDHLNLTGANPLVGRRDPRSGSPFVDMSDAYATRLRRIADEVASALNTPVAHGVYAGVLGPSYETPAEVRALRHLGADVVGMSMVLEAIVAKHAGLEVLGLSLVTNPAAGTGNGPLRHDEVLAAGRAGAAALFPLLEGVIERL